MRRTIMSGQGKGGGEGGGEIMSREGDWWYVVLKSITGELGLISSVRRREEIGIGKED
jgi:hypothetical protein